MAKKRKTPNRPPGGLPRALAAELDELRRLLARRQWDEADERLAVLERVYPDRPEVLQCRAEVCRATDDMRGFEAACERLLRLRPEDPELTLALAAAYLLNLRPALALATFERFLQKWPEHPEAEETRATVDSLRPAVDEELTRLGLSGPEARELGVLHEQVGAFAEQGRTVEAHRAAEQLLRRQPDFSPTLNNLSQLQATEGRLELAIATAERVLARQPENVHALANLVRFCCLSGREAEGRQWAARLKAAPSGAPDAWLKKAEA